MEVLNQDKVFTLIESSGIKPQGVAAASLGCVSVNQAYLWFGAQKKGKRLSKPVLWMLYRMAQDASLPIVQALAHARMQKDPEPMSNFAMATDEAARFPSTPIPQPTDKPIEFWARVNDNPSGSVPAESNFLRVNNMVRFNYRGSIYETEYRAQRKILFQHLNEDLIAYAEFKRPLGPVVFEEQEI